MWVTFKKHRVRQLCHDRGLQEGVVAMRSVLVKVQTVALVVAVVVGTPTRKNKKRLMMVLM